MQLRELMCSLCAFIVGGPALAVESLCEPTEEVYFSCRIHGSGKSASICGAPGSASSIDKESTYLQYKFGRPGSIEMVFPRKRGNSRQYFEHSADYWKTAGIREDSLKFRSGGYWYTVSVRTEPDESDAGKEINTGTVTVSRPGKTLAELGCESIAQNLLPIVGPVGRNKL